MFWHCLHYKIGFYTFLPQSTSESKYSFIIFWLYVKKKILLKVFLLFKCSFNECKTFQLMFTSYIMVMSLFFKFHDPIAVKNSVALWFSCRLPILPFIFQHRIAKLRCYKPPNGIRSSFSFNYYISSLTPRCFCLSTDWMFHGIFHYWLC